MTPPAYSDSPDSIEANNFEALLQDGITAVKNGDRALALRLLEQAAMMNETDARVWIWLSATTDDMQERREYLQHAVVLDPSNTTAKRGLMLITEMLDQAQAMPEDASVAPQPAPPAEAATVKTYLCPNCGATISYDIHETVLVCQFCGFTRKIDEAVTSESKDQPVDAALPTEQAHRWVENQTRVTCEQCGVVVILPPGQTADSCPYCGANRFVTPTSPVDMVDPQAIGLFKVEPPAAGDSIRAWMKKGLFSPDNLAAQHAGMMLHPAYYPFWLFEGTLEVPWFCDVNIGTRRLPEWEAHTGSEYENFKGVLIPGLRKLLPFEVAGIEPFNTDELVEFSPDYLAGWVALTYDLPLADASLQAREKVIKKVQRTIAGMVEPDHPKRNFSTGEGRWSGLSYKLALLPIYVGNYVFQGNRYRLMVNGQTGKVSGKKPMDTLKVVMLGIIAVIVLILVLVVLSLIGRALAG